MKLTVKLPNFTMTRGKIPGKGGGGLRSLRRNFRKILLWGSVGLAFFVLFAWLSLPTRALAWRISHEAKARGYIVDIEDISISPFGGVTLENVQWTFSPSRPGQVPRSFEIPEVEVDVSLLGLVLGELDVEVVAELDEGRIAAHYAQSAEQSSFSLEVADLPLYGVPKATQALNAPLRGILAINVDLTMPEGKFSEATGAIELTCAACTVGDGQEKLYVPGSAALKSGVVIPEIDMGTLSGRMTVEDGVATSDGPIETKSDDVWIEISGKIMFKDPFAKSRFEMVLKFNLSEELQNESEPMRFMIQTANAKTKLDPPEQGLGFKLEGPISKPRFYGIKTKSRRQSRLERRQKQQERDAKRRAKKSKKKRPTSKPKTKDDGDQPADDDKPKIGEPLDVKPFDPGEDSGRPALPNPSEPGNDSAGDETPQYPPDPSSTDDPPQDDEQPQDDQQPQDDEQPQDDQQPQDDEQPQDDQQPQDDPGDGNDEQPSREPIPFDGSDPLEGEGGEGGQVDGGEGGP